MDQVEVVTCFTKKEVILLVFFAIKERNHAEIGLSVVAKYKPPFNLYLQHLKIEDYQINEIPASITSHTQLNSTHTFNPRKEEENINTFMVRFY